MTQVPSINHLKWPRALGKQRPSSRRTFLGFEVPSPELDKGSPLLTAWLHNRLLTGCRCLCICHSSVGWRGFAVRFPLGVFGICSQVTSGARVIWRLEDKPSWTRWFIPSPSSRYRPQAGNGPWSAHTGLLPAWQAAPTGGHTCTRLPRRGPTSLHDLPLEAPLHRHDHIVPVEQVTKANPDSAGREIEINTFICTTFFFFF